MRLSKTLATILLILYIIISILIVREVFSCLGGFLTAFVGLALGENIYRDYKVLKSDRIYGDSEEEEEDTEKHGRD